nr:MAG TPA: hypothetical protein [Caudoviricetes sp.]
MSVKPSDKWLSQYNNTLVPETFIQITYHATDDAAQTDAIASSGSQTVFSNAASITDLDISVSGNYATAETNFWVLDGSLSIVPDSEPYQECGYVSGEYVSSSNHPTITFSFSKIHEEKIPGLTIVWSEILNEWAKSFKISAYKGTALLLEKQIDNNDSIETPIEFEISNYDSVVIEVLEWCIPNRRARISQVEFGQRVRFSKTDLLSYSHKSKRDPISGQLSKDSISFSIDNSDQKWNPINPDGLHKYLYERQAVFVKYGMDLDGQTEWINGGKFYLSSWSIPSNGITASFEARDALAFLIDSPYTGRKSGTLYEICYDALELLDVSGISYYINESLKNYTTDFSNGNSSYKNADVLQLSANAAGMALYQTRNGEIRIDRVPYLPENKSDIYEITEINDYQYPEITFSNKLKNISYSLNGASSLYPNGATGDGVTQSVNNALISSSIVSQPKNVLTESYKVLSNRRKATLSYRASPHNDALDFVKLNHQFGYSSNLLITDVSYTFNGSFKGSVTGYMIEDVDSLQIDASEIYLHPSDTITLTATLAPASADSPVIVWNASPAGIVELNVIKNERGVSVCNVTYLHSGNATITATVASLSASCNATTIADEISDLKEGDIVYVSIAGVYTAFLVSKHNYEPELNGVGRTLLVHKDSIFGSGSENFAWDSKSTTPAEYSKSTIDALLNSSFKKSLSDYMQKKIDKTTFYYTPAFKWISGESAGSGYYKPSEISTLSRSVFLPSAKEINYDFPDDNSDYVSKMWGYGCNAEGSTLPTAKELSKGPFYTYGGTTFAYQQWTRTPITHLEWWGMDSSVGDIYYRSIVVSEYYDKIHLGSSDNRNEFSYFNCIGSGSGNYKCYRPAFTVPQNLKVGYQGRIEEE